MLTEIPDARQVPGEGTRRWFTDAEFDLIVWYHGDVLVGFQLCYDRHGYPRAYTWTVAGGRSHHAIDDGEGSPSGGKATPILVADGSFDPGQVLPKFRAASAEVPPEIRAMVLDKIAS